MAAAQAEYGTSQMPLAGAVLCFTSIPPEQRADLAAVGAQMGAAIKLDLTSDVTHLIVGNTNSAKYRYVAKSREDVRVLLPGWLDALRTVWVAGEDVDTPALEQQFRLPTFYHLKICLTGFEDPDRRRYIQETVVQNGAEYHGDLTKSVTHLIAAVPEGKKYEHALQWHMKIVTWEWFEQSYQRGMALDESHYHPTMPVAERGQGAWDRSANTSPKLGKRTRPIDQDGTLNPLRRKLRRSASSRLQNEHRALWAGITAASVRRKKNDEDEWTEGIMNQPDALPTTDRPRQCEETTQVQAPSMEPASRTRGPFSDDSDGIFAGRLVLIWGFDRNKTTILKNHLDSNSAVVTCAPEDLGKYTADDIQQGFLCVPHDMVPTFTSLPEAAGDMSAVTNWWVERCLHGKRLVDPAENLLCKPFAKLSITGFNSLIINTTGFTGIDLLQVTKTVVLFGATYDEVLSQKTSVLVCRDDKPKTEKLKFATEKRIPVVHTKWLWRCISSGEVQPYADYMLNMLPPQPQGPEQNPQNTSHDALSTHVSDDEKLRIGQEKIRIPKLAPKPCGAPRRPESFELSAPKSPSRASDDDLVINNPISGVYDGAESCPLKDINPGVNSPRRPPTSSNTNTKPGPLRPASLDPITKARRVPPKPGLAAEPTPDSVIPPHTEPLVAPAVTNSVGEKDYSSIMSKLLASRKTSSLSEKQEEQGRRRRRPLGRADSGRSNQSSAGDSLVSRQSSNSKAGEEEVAMEDGEVPIAFQLPEPSQQLGWDSPGAQRAREQMIRAIGGNVVEAKTGIDEAGVVKDATSEEPLETGRMSRLRRV